MPALSSTPPSVVVLRTSRGSVFTGLYMSAQGFYRFAATDTASIGFQPRAISYVMAGGLAAAIILILLSPVFWGTETSVFKNVGTAIWPLNNPGIVSIPLGFFLGWLGSVTSRKAEDPKKAAEMEVRSLTGYGAEKAVDH